MNALMLGVTATGLPLLVGWAIGQENLARYGVAAAQARAWPYFTLALAALLAALILISLRMARFRFRLALHAHGLRIRPGAGHPVRLLYSNISAIIFVPWKEVLLGCELRQGIKVIIQPATGKSILLNPRLERLDEIADILKEKVYPGLRAGLTQAYQAGQSLYFGPMRLWKDKLAINDEVIPLSALRRVEVENGRLLVEWEGQGRPLSPAKHRPKLRRCWLSLEVIPNLEILFDFLQS
jgi:hypothetical protein